MQERREDAISVPVDAVSALASSILVIVDDASSVEAVLSWSLHQADRRHSRVDVLYVPAFLHGDEGWGVDRETVRQGEKELSATLERLGAGSRASLDVGDSGESTTAGIRAKALNGPDDLVMVGPLATDTLVRLVFGSTRHGADAEPELILGVVPRSAWATSIPRSAPSSLTVGFHGSDQAVDALAWAVAEANRRNGAVRAVMAWCEGDYGGLGGPVGIETGARPPHLTGHLAHELAAESLSRCGVPTDRVSTIARRGMPARILIQEAAGSDLLAISAGQSTVFGHRTLGAITLACLNRSPVPVVIVPRHAAHLARSGIVAETAAGPTWRAVGVR